MAELRTPHPAGMLAQTLPQSSATAVPSDVAQFTLTVPAEAAERETVNVAVVVPLSPSDTLTSEIERVGAPPLQFEMTADMMVAFWV